jgi:hypothetical protein
MTVQTWFTLIGICCTVIVTVTTWGFITGKWSTSEAARVTRLHDKMEGLEAETRRRFEDAGNQTSKAMSYIQGVELRCARDLANRELTDERFQENRREHDVFARELDRLRPKRTGD